MDPFELLGVAPGASLTELRAARRRLAKELHPDLGEGRTNAAMAEVNAAFQAIATDAAEPIPDAAEADQAPPPPAEPTSAPPPPKDPPSPPVGPSEATFSVDVLPVEACEILIVVCRILGEVLAVEEPYAIEAYLEAPEPCFAALTLVPEAGGTQVTIEAEPAEPSSPGAGDAWRGPEAVRDAILDELIALTTPARPATH
jgi:hypothetical protein